MQDGDHLISDTVQSTPSLLLPRIGAGIDSALLAPAGRNGLGAGAGAGERQASFAEILGRSYGPGLDGRSIEERARSGAEQLVAVSLVQPLLKQLRESSQAAPPFAPTSGEKQLRALQDAEVARQVVRAGRFPMVERLAQRMLMQADGAPSERAAGSGKGS